MKYLIFAFFCRLISLFFISMHLQRVFSFIDRSISHLWFWNASSNVCAALANLDRVAGVTRRVACLSSCCQLIQFDSFILIPPSLSQALPYFLFSIDYHSFHNHRVFCHNVIPLIYLLIVSNFEHFNFFRFRFSMSSPYLDLPVSMRDFIFSH